MTTKEIKERVFDLSAICAGQEIMFDEKDITALKAAFKGLCKLEKIEQTVMKSPDEFKQCTLKDLKDILDILDDDF